MTVDPLINLLATGIAFVLGLFSRSLYGRFDRSRKRRSSERSRRERHPSYSAAWLIEYYRRRGRLADLFTVDCDGGRLVVPFLLRDS